MTPTTIRLEPTLKQDFARVCDELGLTVSGAMTIFAKTVVREQKIPFEVALNPYVITKQDLDNRVNNLKSGKGLEREIVEDLE
jgi:DNA-damage-inducible protein J